jgi:hypothetical protein
MKIYIILTIKDYRSYESKICNNGRVKREKEPNELIIYLYSLNWSNKMYQMYLSIKS